jgi:hypothetical protein
VCDRVPSRWCAWCGKPVSADVMIAGVMVYHEFRWWRRARVIAATSLGGRIIDTNMAREEADMLPGVRGVDEACDGHSSRAGRLRQVEPKRRGFYRRLRHSTSRPNSQARDCEQHERQGSHRVALSPARSGTSSVCGADAATLATSCFSR